MTSFRNLIRAGLVALSMACLSPIGALAQEFTESHLAAARAAVGSSPLSANFDSILPTLVQRVQDRLIAVRPDLHESVAETVQAVALRLVARRSDLDKAAALLWARAFTEDELVAINEFYSSAVGKKFLTLGAEINSSMRQARENWQSRVGEELLDKTREDLKKLGHEF